MALAGDNPIPELRFSLSEIQKLYVECEGFAAPIAYDLDKSLRPQSTPTNSWATTEYIFGSETEPIRDYQKGLSVSEFDWLTTGSEPTWLAEERPNVVMRSDFRKALWSPSVAFKESGIESYFNARPHLRMPDGRKIPILEADHIYALPRWTSEAEAAHARARRSRGCRPIDHD
ncbi:hypothetical protein AB1Y20_008605 [Prymnesium parvum]|uniref:Uncharacterized protein n=1 Tax=Prymnesium parvum TaxID=97485 RepID=A0AB34ITJ4_PRYPA